MRITTIGSTLVLGLTAGTSLGVQINVNNPSFEAPGAGVPSWSAFGGSGTGVYVPIIPTTYDSVPDGVQVAYLYNNGARIYQTTTHKLGAGRVYNLSAYLGERNDLFQPRTIITILPESEIPDYLADPFGGGTDHLSFVQVEPFDIAPREFKQFTTTFDTTLPGNAALVSQYAGQNLVVTITAVANGETDVDLVDFSYIPSGPTQWNVNASGDWNNDSNWSEGIPNGIDIPANFLNAIASPQTIYTNTPVTVGSMNFDNSSGYQVTGQGSLTLEVSGGSSQINVLQGSQKLNLPTFFASDTTITVAGGATLTLADPVTIRANKTVTRNGNVSIEAPLTIEANGVLNIASGPAATLFNAPSLASGAKINVQNNSLVIDYRGQISPAATIQAQLVSGHNNGAWDGDGIMTSSATNATGLGWIDNSATESITVKFTYNGDADLNGTVDSNDFNAFVAAYGATGGAIWVDGDFNYDGKVNTEDFNDLSGNFGLTIPAPAALGASVPEPGIAAVGVLGVVGLLRRQRRRVR